MDVSYTMRAKIVVFEFVFKCIMAGILILFLVVTVPLISVNFSLSLLICSGLLLGLFIIVRSILWDILGKEIVTITEQDLTIAKLMPFSKKAVTISAEDIISIDKAQYVNELNNCIFINSMKFWRYLISIVSLNRGYIIIQTIYRSYNLCIDIRQRDPIINRLKTWINHDAE